MTSFEEEASILGRPGSDLLSQGLSHSTIGAEEFNGRVRDGIGFRLLARTTRPAKDKEYEASGIGRSCCRAWSFGCDPQDRRDRAKLVEWSFWSQSRSQALRLAQRPDGH